MERIAIIDSHHHLWDLDSKETHYPWLSSDEEKAFYGSFKSIKTVSYTHLTLPTMDSV